MPLAVLGYYVDATFFFGTGLVVCRNVSTKSSSESRSGLKGLSIGLTGDILMVRAQLQFGESNVPFALGYVIEFYDKDKSAIFAVNRAMAHGTTNW